jgi:hypothetical protein
MGAALLKGISFSRVRLTASISVSSVVGYTLRRYHGNAANTKCVVD